MGKDIAAQSPAAREVFQQADAVLGFALSELCFEGPQEALDDTINTQPALFTCGIATLRALQALHPEARPAMVAGHSLGELTALVAADALSFEDGLRLVRERGRLMKEAGERNPGAMAAILGLENEIVQQLCQQASEETNSVVVLANDNCPGQVVISGDEQGIVTAIALAQQAGAKRAMRLAVSIASHSPLMEAVVDEFRRAVANANLRTPTVPVYGNVNAEPLTDVEAIRHELEVQLTQPVRWTAAAQAMIRDGASGFVEIGPKEVLSGLIKRIDRSVERFSLNSSLALHEFSAALT